MKLFSKLIALLLLCVATNVSAQVPVLNSYPSADAVLFLDFDGHTVEGTSWNYDGPIICNGANLPDAKITEIFNRIAEDYRPFAINVTTDSTKYLAAPALKRMRALFTTSNSWYGNSAGGVAFVNSFSWGDNTPCFIFTALFNYNVKNISEAGSHEIGHTLGLSHQASYDANCNKTSDYHYGIGDGETGWAPIMGVGYYKNFTVWHNGSDPYGCNSTQSDLSIITGAANGFGFRTDDHDSTIAAATTAAFAGNQFAVNGVVAKTTDVDVFKFVMPSDGRFQLEGIPYNVGTGNTGSDLDLQVDITDAAENIIGSYNPGNALNTIVDTLLPMGTYYLKVDGKGNQYTSEYGSLGSYSLRGTYTSPLPLRKLILKGTQEGSQHQLAWFVDADETILKQEVQVSEEGNPYTTIAQPASTSNTYAYIPTTAKTLHYRISITFSNGRQHYSNVIALKKGQLQHPQIVGNVLSGNAIMVNSPYKFDYAIVDYNGRKLAKGAIYKGASTIVIDAISKGNYIIYFTSGQQQFVEKFVKL